MNNYLLELKWAVIYTTVLFLWMLMERLLGWHDAYIAKHHLYTLFFIIPAALIYYLALVDKRNNFYGGIMTYRQGFLAALWVTIYLVLFAAPTQYIINTWITPEYFENIKAYSITSGKATPQEAADFFNLKSYTLQAVLGTLFMGILLSVLLPWVAKRS